jgi:hypothetical protein
VALGRWKIHSFQEVRYRLDEAFQKLIEDRLKSRLLICRLIQRGEYARVLVAYNGRANCNCGFLQRLSRFQQRPDCAKLQIDGGSGNRGQQIGAGCEIVRKISLSKPRPCSYVGLRKPLKPFLAQHCQACF